MIYFAKMPTGAIKIGTTSDVDRRMTEHQQHFGCELEVLHTMEGGRDVEVSLHRRFKHLRIGAGEQFRPGPDLLEFIGRPILVDVNPDAVEAAQPAPGYALSSVKMDAKLVQMARIVAAHRNVPLGKLLSDMLEGPIESRTARMLRELTQASQPAADDAPARPSRRKPKAP